MATKKQKILNWIQPQYEEVGKMIDRHPRILDTDPSLHEMTKPNKDAGVATIPQIHPRAGPKFPIKHRTATHAGNKAKHHEAVQRSPASALHRTEHVTSPGGGGEATKTQELGTM